MGWKFPKRVPKAGQAISAQDVNEGLLPYVEEFGKLNEHNMGVALKTSLDYVSQLDTDVGMRFKHASVTDEQGQNVTTGDYSYIPPIDTWVVIDDMTASITTDGQVLYALFTVQYSASLSARSTAGVGTQRGNDEAFLQLGIRLDGALLPNTVIGDQDADYSVGSMETGVTGMAQGLTVDATFPIAPGTHTVELVGRVSVRTDVQPGAEDLGARIHSREYLLLEMR